MSTKAKKNLVVDISTKNQGLPAKSFMYIISLDFYLKLGLSYLSNTNFFPIYLSSFIHWKFKYKDRERLARDYLKFVCTYNESGIGILINSNFFARTDMIIFLNKVDSAIRKYKTLSAKDSNELTLEEQKYLFKFNSKFSGCKDGILMSIPTICEKINSIQSILISHYLAFILKGLVKQRKVGEGLDKLKTDAYETLLNMINSYDPYRSKVPFSNYLKFFIRNKKNLIIKRETWGVKGGTMLFLDDETLSTKAKKDGISELIDYHIERKRKVEDYNVFMESLSEVLPKFLYKTLALNFSIIDPLTHSEEIKLAVA